MTIFTASFSINQMLKVLLFLCLLLLPSGQPLLDGATPEQPLSAPGSSSGWAVGEALFEEMQLGGIVNFLAFREAVAGYLQIAEKTKPIMTLIDFTKPSTEKRLYVFDMEKKKMVYSSVVAHGRNSGANYATSFSNEYGSYKSSLGFYLTENTYQGKNGYSLSLNGLEAGINDRAKQRAIVMHGAAYANPSTIASGRLGRSLGCPALPQALARPIIDTIKKGSVLFIYANDERYREQSSLLAAGKSRAKKLAQN